MKLKNQPINNKLFFTNSGIAKVQAASWIQKQQEAARILKDTMQLITTMLLDYERYTLEEINLAAEQNILKYQATPTFKGYQGFPNTLCLSVNHCLLHGIFTTGQKLQSGDKITVDFGVTYQGAIVDSARTFIVGDNINSHLPAMNLLGMQCLTDLINLIYPEDPVGKIGAHIAKIIESKNFVLVEKYGGHAISDNQVHDYPFVANKADAKSGIRLFPGMSFAVEPIILPPKSNPEVSISEDKWSLFSQDIGVHCEDSYLMTDHGLINLTA